MDFARGPQARPSRDAAADAVGTDFIAALRGRFMSRSLLSGLVGILIATIGLSPRDVLRGTFNLPELLDGVPVVAAMIGLFAASELFNLAGTSYLVSDPTCAPSGCVKSRAACCRRCAIPS